MKHTNSHHWLIIVFLAALMALVGCGNTRHTRRKPNLQPVPQPRHHVEVVRLNNGQYCYTDGTVWYYMTMSNHTVASSSLTTVARGSTGSGRPGFSAGPSGSVSGLTRSTESPAARGLVEEEEGAADRTMQVVADEKGQILEDAEIAAAGIIEAEDAQQIAEVEAENAQAVESFENEGGNLGDESTESADSTDAAGDASSSDAGGGDGGGGGDGSGGGGGD